MNTASWANDRFNQELRQAVRLSAAEQAPVWEPWWQLRARYPTADPDQLRAELADAIVRLAEERHIVVRWCDTDHQPSSAPLHPEQLSPLLGKAAQWDPDRSGLDDDDQHRALHLDITDDGMLAGF